jgi:hypothetical protein
MPRTVDANGLDKTRVQRFKVHLRERAVGARSEFVDESAQRFLSDNNLIDYRAIIEHTAMKPLLKSCT